MQDLCNLGSDLGPDAELFFQLTVKRLRWCFRSLDLAAGKFPLERKCLMLGPLTAQYFVSAPDESGNYLLGQCGFLETTRMNAS